MMTVMVAMLISAEPAAWKKVEEADGITIESRPVEGSSLVELRLTQEVKADAMRLCDEVFGTGKFDSEEPDLKSRKVLQQSENERVTYDQMQPPIVSNRDFAVRAKRERRDDGSCTMSFALANELAPKAPEGYVRLAMLKGYWTFTPSGGGKTKLIYVVHSDPGGSIPAFMMEGTRRKIAVKWIQLMVGRAQKPAKVTGAPVDAGT